MTGQLDLSPEAGWRSVALNHRIDDIGVGATPLQYLQLFHTEPKKNCLIFHQLIT